MWKRDKKRETGAHPPPEAEPETRKKNRPRRFMSKLTQGLKKIEQGIEDLLEVPSEDHHSSGGSSPRGRGSSSGDGTPYQEVTSTLYLGPFAIRSKRRSTGDPSTAGIRSSTGKPLPTSISPPSKEMRRWLTELSSSSFFEEADERAFSAVPPSDGGGWSVKSLAHYLTSPYSKEKAEGERERLAQEDLLKTRALFAWIAHNVAYDVEAFASGSTSREDQRAEKVLQRGKAVCEGYANLFLALARECSLEAFKVTGLGKGGDFGTTAVLSDLAHAWNSVLIGEEWHLLDCCWGAGHIKENGRFKFSFTPFFFLTKPSHFIYSHYPDLLQWQLLPEEKQLSKTNFLKLPHIFNNYFEYGVKMVSHKEGLIRVREGEERGEGGEDDAPSLKIVLACPSDVFLISELVGRHKSQRLTFCQRNPFTSLHEISIRYPCEEEESGEELLLHVYASRAGPESKVMVERRRDLRQSVGRKYDVMLEYSIKMEREDTGREKRTGPFPKAFTDFEGHAHFLFSPMEGNLVIGKTYSFRVYGGSEEEESKKCMLMGLKMPSNSYKELLLEEKEEGGIVVFEKQVRISGREGDEVILYAQYKGQRNVFRSVLRYVLVAA
ncbi:TGc domain-containing protein [Balamuthia mandrillaris]